MDTTTRRDFIKFAGITAINAPMVKINEKIPEESLHLAAKFQLGTASYTFRAFSLEQTIAMTQRLDIKRIAFKSFHLPLEAPPEEIRRVAQFVRDAGLELYGCGVVYMTNEAEVARAFEYAKTAQMKIIIGVPNHDMLELVNKKVQEYDIIVAIHNHGPGDLLYPSPQSVYDKIKNLDKRIGLCIDVGHTQRIGQDPSEAILLYADRLYDVHIKDVSEATAEGTTVEIGRGVIDMIKLLRTLISIQYQGTAAFEFEKDEKDPLPGVAESVGYVRGALKVLSQI
jgi:inosose dehydratase